MSRVCAAQSAQEEQAERAATSERALKEQLDVARRQAEAAAAAAAAAAAEAARGERERERDGGDDAAGAPRAKRSRCVAAIGSRHWTAESAAADSVAALAPSSLRISLG